MAGRFVKDSGIADAVNGEIKEHNIKTDNLPQGTSSSSLKVKSNGFSISELQGALPDGEKPLLIVDDKEFSGC